VFYNRKEIKRYAQAPDLFESQEIITPDDAVIHLRFLKDLVDFEVFLDGEQVDNSETSPAKIVDSLRYPVYFGIGWYILILFFAAFAYDGIYSYIFSNPESLLFDWTVFQMITSSVAVILILATTLITLKSGSLVVYYLALAAVVLDAACGVMTQLIAMPFTSGNSFVVTLFFIGIPLVFKSILIRSFYNNAEKYKQYIRQKAAQKQKTNENVIDL
jgi:hypothetical protein